MRRCRLPGNERGFSLMEVLVTILIMGVVFSALHGIFSMSLRVFSFGNDKVEATQDARLAMERMTREIRAAYPIDVVDDDRLLGTACDPDFGCYPGSVGIYSRGDRICFGNDLNADYQLSIYDNAGPEIICYYQNGTQLVRRTGYDTGARAENLVPLGSRTLPSGGTETGSLQLTYFRNSCASGPVQMTIDPTNGVSAGDQPKVTRIGVRLKLIENEHTQELQTEVNLRGRSDRPCTNP